MAETEVHKALRTSMTEWVEAHLRELTYDDPEQELPGAVDFLLLVATEDLADADSPTYYHFVTSGTSHYRKVGLLACAEEFLVHNDRGGD